MFQINQPASESGGPTTSQIEDRFSGNYYIEQLHCWKPVYFGFWNNI